MDKKRITVLSLFSIIFIIGIILSLFYYKGKYIIKFETGNNEIILNQYVKKGYKVKKPENPTKDGYKFVCWEYKGNEYNFNEKVTKDLILSARWVKEEYITIYFDTETIYEIDSIKILKGSSIQELPSVEKEGYEFNGWLLNGNIYNNEELNSDTKLSAKFTKIKEELKIGDRVYIIGPYSSSSYSNDYNILAIGWDRVILDILDSRENPYVIGNEFGVTGFFKESSLKKSGFS